MSSVALRFAFGLVLIPHPALLAAGAAFESDADHLAFVEARIGEAVEEATPAPLVPEHLQACIGGMAGGAYPCSNIDLLEFIPLSTFGATLANSGWGWTDTQGTPETADDREYYLLGLNNGTAFVDITNPENAVYLGKLPSHGGSNTWRDVRVHANHAYIVSELAGHGMQVFDLTQLRNVASPPATFTETAHYNRVSNTHTISINETSGYAYLVGTTGTGGSPNVVTCDGNMHIVSLANPTNPQFVACYNDDPADPANTYVHENQCFIYAGPDDEHDGKEICLAARGGTQKLDIIDVTNHAAPVRLDSFQYSTGGGYSHQAWFTDDHRYVLLNDELDETGTSPTRTWIMDAADLDNVVPAGPGFFEHATVATDHNLYVRGNFVFQSNYRAGLRILQLTDPANAELTEIGFFDVYPSSDSSSMNGTWNNYPFFASGVIPVTHIEQGLFLLKPTNLCTAPGAPTGLAATPNGDQRIDLDWSGSGAVGATFRVERALGGCTGVFETIASGLVASDHDDLTASGVVTYGYRIVEADGTGLCASDPSTCVEASTTGSCTAPPAFGGIESASDAGSVACTVALDWSAATAFCGGPVEYSVYRGSTPTFSPAPENRVAQGIDATGFNDLGAPSGQISHYVVRAVDDSNGIEEANLVRRSATATGPPADGTFATSAEPGDPTMDTGDAIAPEHAGWHISDARHATGGYSFWSTDTENLCVTLEESFDLTAGQSSTVTFATAWDIETGWDGGVVELSLNGAGGPWTRLTPSGGYPGTIADGGTICGIAEGSGAFTGTGQLANFVPASFDLSAWDGETVRLRWLYRTDGAVNGEGWYVDDIAITHVQLPGTCTPDGIFVDGFESSNAGAWSTVVP